MNFFILGSHPKLSKSEIAAVLGQDSETIPATGEVLLVNTADPNLGALQDRLAGTIKLGSIIGELADWNIDEAANLIAAFAQSASGEGKIYFGISVYDGGEVSLLKELRQSSEKLGLEVKKRLKATDRPIRLVTSKDKTLSAVVITKNHLLESGGEYVLIPTKDKILIGQTEAVQDFEGWSDRDYGRPARDPKSGMLPPKLARMMINLSGANPESSVLLDPFCGSGTVLMEAALLGFHHIIGSDISEKAIADTQTNLKWMDLDAILKSMDEDDNVELSPTIDKSFIDLIVSPAESLKLDAPVDVVVTETFLGPPRSGGETRSELENRINDLMKMYIPSFKSIFNLLKPNSKAVVALPAYVFEKELLRVPIENELKTIGFTITDRFIYKRPKQFVAREILVLQK